MTRQLYYQAALLALLAGCAGPARNFAAAPNTKAGCEQLQAWAAEKYFRDSKICTIGEGTSEIQRLVIARQLLKGR